MTQFSNTNHILRGRGQRVDQPGARFNSHHSIAFQGWINAPRIVSKLR